MAGRKIPIQNTDPTIRLSPGVPGMLPVRAGVTYWPTSISTRSLEAVEWRVFDARDQPRSDWIALADPTLTSEVGVPVAVPLLATGDRLRVRAPGNDAVSSQSLRARLVPADPAEPAIPNGWVISLYDDFKDTRLDRGNWRLVVSNEGRDPALVTARSGGLVLQAVRGADGAYRTSAIQAGGSALGGPAYGDLQVSVKLRAEPGQGLGLLASLVPYRAGATLPRMDVQTAGAGKQTLRITNRWPGNPAGVAVDYPVDLTRWHVVTLRRTAGRWNLWIDQTEQAVPQEWGESAYLDALTLVLAAQALAGGEGPDEGSPVLWSGSVDFVKVSVPG